MLHAYTWNWLHIVWGTKNHERILFKELSEPLYQFILKKSDELEVSVEKLNIQPEHLHLLINLPANICLSDYIHNIKGSSSFWINKNEMINSPFQWQRGYAAFSVSQRELKKVKYYIQNQSQHHKNKSYKSEYEEWKEEYVDRSKKE